jgi:hypothetical protein
MFGFFYFEFDLVNQEFTQMQQSQKNWSHNTGGNKFKICENRTKNEKNRTKKKK